MKNVHLLSTNQSYLSLNRKYTDYMIGTESGEPYWVYTKSWLNNMSCTDDSCVPHNMYITSDEEIKEGDWVYNFEYDYVVQYYSKKHDDKFWYKKIILTTDPELIKDGVQAIDDEFLEWFVKNPSCEYVEVENQWEGNGTMFGFKMGNASSDGEFVYKIIIPKEELKTSEEWQKQFPNTKVIDPDGWDRKNYQYSWFEEKITLIEYTSRLHRSTVKGIIPKEETKQDLPQLGIKEFNNLVSVYFDGKPKQETLEDFIKRESTSVNESIGIIKGANWQSERSYSEEEVIDFLQKMNDWPTTFEGKIDIREWFNQFKKK